MVKSCRSNHNLDRLKESKPFPAKGRITNSFRFAVVFKRLILGKSGDLKREIFPTDNFRIEVQQKWAVLGGMIDSFQNKFSVRLGCLVRESIGHSPT
jgi:hypothetical protein